MTIPSRLTMHEFTAQPAAPCGCDTLATSTSTPSPPTLPTAAPGATANWEGTLGVEGELTGDGRLISPNALRWDVPMPMRYVLSDVGSHDGAVTVGTILTVARRPGGVIWGTGTIDLETPEGVAAAAAVGKGLQNGVSMDLDDVSFEIRVAQELLDEDPLLGMMMGLAVADTPPPAVDPNAPTPPDCSCAEGDANYDPDCVCDEAPPMAVDADGRVTVMEMKSDDEVRVTTDGRIRAATIVSIPAFATATISMTGDTAPAPAPAVAAAALALVASAAPPAPPAVWFTAPDLDQLTPLTVSDTGRVYGHLASWNTCHTSHTAPGQCVTAPHSVTGYAYFHTGAIITKEGTEVAVGHLTLNTRHAGDRLSATAAAAHYEDTGAVVADVVAGEDAHGIFVAGSMRASATDQQTRELRSSPLSGDWRRIRGNLELVAALGVNVPGFPIPRPAGLVAGGLIQSLVASGMVPPRSATALLHATADLSDEDLTYLRRLAAREKAADQDMARRKVHAFALRRRAHAMRGTT